MLPPAIDPIDAYIRRVSEIPRLKAAHELHLIRGLHGRRRERAMEALVLSHLRLVVDIAFDYLKFEQAFDDLIQEGNLALVHAVTRFDPRGGERLSSFLGYRINVEIGRYVLDSGSVVKRGITKEQGKLFVRTSPYRQGRAQLSGSQIKAVAAMVGARPAELARLELRRGQPDDMAGAGPGVLRNQQLLELQGDDGNEIERLEQTQWRERQEDSLQRGMAALDLRALDIVRRRWLRTGRKREPLRSLASEYRISGERVRQIQQDAFDALRGFLG